LRRLVRRKLRFEMALLADLIGLLQPGSELSIDVAPRRDAEAMDMVARRDGLNAPKTRMLKPAR